MNKIIKKLLLTIFLIIITFCIASCSKVPGGSIGGYPLRLYDEFILDEKKYEIFILPEDEIDLNEDYYTYFYKEYKSEDVYSWTINYYDTYEYLLNRQDISAEEIKVFSDKIQNVLKIYEEKLKISFELHNHKTNLRKEYTITDFNQYEAIYIIDMYIPFRLNIDYNTYIISVPVKTIIGYQIGNQIKLTYNDDIVISIPYLEFINGSNVYIK